MTPEADSRAALESVFGALSDWLERVRLHEQRRREITARRRQARREQAVAWATFFGSAVVGAVLIWLGRSGAV